MDQTAFCVENVNFGFGGSFLLKGMSAPWSVRGRGVFWHHMYTRGVEYIGVSEKVDVFLSWLGEGARRLLM